MFIITRNRANTSLAILSESYKPQPFLFLTSFYCCCCCCRRLLYLIWWPFPCHVL